MKRHTLFLFLLIAAAAFADDALEWPTFRHDHQRTGHSPGVGNIRDPVVVWRYPIGARRALVEISSQSGERKLRLPFSQDIRPGKSFDLRDWDGSYRLLDLAGDGKCVRVHETHNIRYAKFLPEARGYQKLYFEDGMAVKSRPNGPHKPVARGFLYRYDHGHEELVWQTNEEPQCEIPLCAVADMDGDGRLDIAVSTWWRVMVFDGATGTKKMECRWHKGRNYGHFELVNLPDHRYPTCVVLADFMIHFDALTNDGRQLSLQWRKEIDFTLFQKSKAVRVGPHPILSLRGDGTKQIVTNIYNDSGDKRWHVVVLDVATGDTLADLPDRFLHGTADLAGDGRAALLLSEAHALATPLEGRLFIGRWQKNGLVEETAPHRGHWLTCQETHLPPTQATIAADGSRAALVSDLDGNNRAEAWIATRDSDGRENLMALEPASAWRETARIQLPPRNTASVAGVRLGGNGLPNRVLLQLDSNTGRDDAGALAGLNADIHSVDSAPLPLDVPVVARMRPGGPAVIVAAGGGELIALSAPAKHGEPPRELWRAPGRAQTSDAASFSGLEMADLNNDGCRQVLAARSADNGSAVLAAYDADGKECWRHEFTRFPGSEPVWNTGGLLFWTAGRFAGANQTGVFASLRRGAMHTEESCVVDGKTGREIWWQDNLLQRGCVDAPVALIAAGDGREDIIGQYPDIHFQLSGADGKPVRVAAFSHAEFGGWTAYGMPVLFDANGDGQMEELFGRCRYSLALFGGDGKTLWHSDYLDGCSSAPALADLCGDKHRQIGAAAYRGGFRCADAATGAIRWSHATRGTPTDPAAADIDGDGREKFIFAAGKELIALGDDGAKPRVVWKLALPVAAHPPILADVDGDGKLEILCMAADGFLYCIADRHPTGGQAKRLSP